MSKREDIEAVMRDAQHRAEALMKNEHRRTREILECVEARTNAKTAMSADLSVDLFKLMTQMLSAMKRLGVPNEMSTELFEQCMTLHSRITAHMLAASCEDDDKLKREVHALTAMFDSQFAAHKAVSAIADEATNTINRLLDKE